MKKAAWSIVAGLAFANILVWPYVAQSQNLRVTFFDVGQGDAIFIETPQGHQILVDGGPSNIVAEKLGQALPFWDRSLDMVALTHADADHISGLVGVFEQYDVENVLWTGVKKDTSIFTKWNRLLLKEEANVFLARAGQKLAWSSASGAFMSILSPDESIIARAKEVNDTSIVARVVFGANSFLLTGDISKTTEQWLVESEVGLSSDVLKVPHHGSASSSSENFLAAVSPKLAVIQVGVDNRYGHPTQEALLRLVNIPVLRTDHNGDILVQTDGKHIWY